MKTIIKKINMECVSENHFKEWHATLYDDNTVVTEWGKINSNLSSKEFPFATQEDAEAFMIKKAMEKEKKGYLPQ